MKLPFIDTSTLVSEYGKGGNLTCFATDAIGEWDEHIPPPSFVSKGDRRQAILLLATYYNFHPCQMVGIVRLHRSALRMNKSWPPTVEL
jgi:hypothetical protein